MKKYLKIMEIIIKELFVITGMILLIPLVINDYLLAFVYLLFSLGRFLIRYDKLDWLFFVFALFAMTASESLFVSTGVETFQRNTLFGLMPIWLPILWAYVFVVMRRLVKILDKLNN